MHSVYYKIIAATIAIVTAAFVFAPRTDGQGGPGTINQLDQWRFDGTNVTQNVANTPVRITGLESENCLGTDASGVLQAGTCTGGGGGSGTVTSVGLAVPTGLTVSGSPVTASGTLTIGLAGGYVIPLTASTSEWSAAFASTTALTPAYIRSLFSETVNGLDYGSGVLSLTSGFTIPLTASTTQWNTAFGWGNHATAGYLTSIATSTVRGMFSASSPLSYSTTTGAFTLSTAGDWTGTFDGQEGTYYLSRANHSGTQLASTISDFTATARGTISETVTGLTYTSATGVLSLDGGFTIPLTASTTNWNAFYDTPSTRITAGANCSWTGNTFNCTGGGGGGGGLATTSPWTLGNLAFVTGQGTVGSVATGTLTETVSGLQFDATRGLVGGSAVLSLSSGFEIPLTASTSQWSAAAASTTALTPAYIRGLLSETVTGLDYSSGVLSLTSGYNIPLAASTTNWNTFYNTPSNRITAGTGLSWSGNTLNATGGGGGGLSTTSPWTVGNLAFVTGQGTVGSIATTTLVAGTGISFTGGTPVIVGSSPITIEATGGGGGGGGALSTTTDQIGDGGVQLVSYVTGDVMFGGSASTSAEFQFDDDGGKFIFGPNATATIQATNDAVSIGETSGSGLEWFFGTAGDAIVRGIGSVTDFVFNIGVQFLAQLYDSTGNAGSNGMVLTSTGTSTLWVATSSLGISGGGGGGTSFLNLRNYVELFDDFLNDSSNAGDAIWDETVAGTSAACSPTGVLSQDFQVVGLISCSTGSTATGRAALTTDSAAFLLGNGTTTFEARVTFSEASNVTNRYQGLIGIFDTYTGINQSDGVWLLYDEGGVTTGSTASANWQCGSASNGVRTFSTSTVQVTNDLNDNLTNVKIVVNASATEALYYVNDTLICTHTTNIPSGSQFRSTGHGAAIFKSVGTTLRSIRLDYMYARHEFTTPR
jgi:hypothetical protein